MDTKEIIQNREAISLEGSVEAKSQICAIWPNVKSGLTLLQGLIKNPIAKAAIGIVIAAGDAVTSQICG
jgi:hypothetical protein